MTLLDRRNAISVDCSKSCITFSLLTTCCFNFETDMSVFFVFFFGRFFLAQLISCFSSTAMPVAVYLSTSPRIRSLFCRGRLLHLDEDATLLSMFRVALGDNESLNYTLRRDLMKQEKTGAMSFFTSSSKTIKRSSSQRTRSSRQRTRARYTYVYVANRPTHTRGLGDSGKDVLVAARLPVPELLFPTLEK